MYNLLPYKLSRHSVKFLKKIRKSNKELYGVINNAIIQITEEPYIGGSKSGDLKGVFSLDIRHNGINYELAYKIDMDEKGDYVLIIMIGTREKFYENLKRYLKN